VGIIARHEKKDADLPVVSSSRVFLGLDPLPSGDGNPPQYQGKRYMFEQKKEENPS